jgi:hypothetical protein
MEFQRKSQNSIFNIDNMKNKVMIYLSVNIFVFCNEKKSINVVFFNLMHTYTTWSYYYKQGLTYIMDA